MKELKRLESGIQGLDAMTNGGFIAGAAYLIQGRPGSGKTILANQIAFNHASKNGKTVFASLLSEPHDRLFQFLSTLNFFDSEKVGTDITYISAFDTLEAEGLEEVVKLLRREILRNKATLLVLDGLMNVRSRSEAPINTKKFIAELQVHASFAGCTIILLTSAEINYGSPELTMVDGVFSLKEHVVGIRSMRRISIHKHRGSGFISGEHEYEISPEGLTIYPRIEEALALPTCSLGTSDRQIESGVPGLDSVFGGGVSEATATLVIGPPGAGKTTIGLNFIASSTDDNKGLFCEFIESPEQLREKSSQLDLGLEELVDTEVVELFWHPTTRLQPDKIALMLLDKIRRKQVSRVVIDSLAALTRPTVEQGRVVEYVSALINEMRALGATIFVSWEINSFPGSDPQVPTPEVCSIFDNIVLIGFDDSQNIAERTLKVLKRRNGQFDRSTRFAKIAQGGFTLLEPSGGGT